MMPAFAPWAAGQEVRVVKLAITPAARPSPAMRYRLFPIPRELKEGNAAALYYRGILQFSQRGKSNASKEISDQERISELLEMDADKIPRDEARKLIEKQSSALHEISIGTRRVRALWDIPLKEDGVQTLLMEMQETRGIARILALRARLEGLEGKFAEAVETIETMIVLARHVSESGTLVSSLIGAAIFGLASEQIEQLACLPGSPNLYWAVTALPEPIIDMKTGFESEQLWLEGSIPYLDILGSAILSKEQATEVEVAVGKLLSEYFQSQPDIARQLGVDANGYLLMPALANYGECKRQLLARGESPQRVEQMPVVQVLVLRWVQTYRELLDEEIAFTGRPHAEAIMAFKQLEVARQGIVGKPESALSDLLLPSTVAAKGAFTRISQRVALLRVIAALRLYAAAHEGQLPAKLSDMDAVPIPLDPVTGAPFDYQLQGGTATILPKPVNATVRYELEVKK